MGGGSGDSAALPLPAAKPVRCSRDRGAVRPHIPAQRDDLFSPGDPAQGPAADAPLAGAGRHAAAGNERADLYGVALADGADAENGLVPAVAGILSIPSVGGDILTCRDGGEENHWAAAGRRGWRQRTGCVSSGHARVVP